MPARVDTDRVRHGGHTVQCLLEAAAVVTLQDEELLEHRETLRLPSAKHRVHHAVRFQPEEQLEAFARQIHFDAHHFVSGVRRDRIRVPHDAAVAPVPVVFLPEDAVLRLLVLELIEPLPELVDRRVARPVPFVEEHAALAKAVAVGVPLFEQRLLRLIDRSQHCAVSPDVFHPDRRRSLMDGVFEEVSRAMLAVAFLEGADAVIQGGRDAGHPAILDDENPESVVEEDLLDVDPEVRPMLRRQRAACRALLRLIRRAKRKRRRQHRGCAHTNALHRPLLDLVARTVNGRCIRHGRRRQIDSGYVGISARPEYPSGPRHPAPKPGVGSPAICVSVRNEGHSEHHRGAPDDGH